MKLRNYAFLFVFVLSITFLLFRPSANGQTQCQTQTINDIENLIQMGSTVVPGNKINKVAKRIQDDYQKLSMLFEVGKDGFEKDMAKILGKKASLKTAGVAIRGHGKIKEYWKRMKKEENYDRVEFELDWAFIVYEEKKPLFAKDTDNIVYENFKYHLIKQSGGEILQNQSGRGERSGRHTQGCKWIAN